MSRTVPSPIAKIQQAIAATVVKLDAIDLEPQARQDLARAVDREVTRASASAEPSLAARVAAADFDAGLLYVRPRPDGRIDLLPPMVALFGADTVRGLLMRFVERAPEGLPAEDRKARRDALTAEILELERSEERAIRAAEREGVEVVRRATANPAVVLADL